MGIYKILIFKVNPKMSSLFDNIFNRVNKNSDRPTKRTRRVDYRRLFCRGCGNKILLKTYKMHKKLFLKPNGVWIPHHFQKRSTITSQKTNKNLKFSQNSKNLDNHPDL